MDCRRGKQSTEKTRVRENLEWEGGSKKCGRNGYDRYATHACFTGKSINLCNWYLLMNINMQIHSAYFSRHISDIYFTAKYLGKELLSVYSQFWKVLFGKHSFISLIYLKVHYIKKKNFYSCNWKYTCF